MRSALLLALAMLLGPFGPLAAQDRGAEQPEAITPLTLRADQVVSLLNGKLQPEDIFTDGFQAAVAPAQIKSLSINLTAQFGAALEVVTLSPHQGARARLEIRFERGLAKGSIGISPSQDNRISELLFTSVDALVVEGDTPDKIAKDLAALPGEVSALFAPLGEGTPVIDVAAQQPAAVLDEAKLEAIAQRILLLPR